MVIISAADGAMSDAELEEIGGIVKKFPIFDDFDRNRLVPVAEECAEILAEDGGLEAAIGLIGRSYFTICSDCSLIFCFMLSTFGLTSPTASSMIPCNSF